MSGRRIGLCQLILAGFALVGAVLSWLASTSVETVAPVLAGEPSMTSTIYDPSLVLLSLVLGGVAGVAAVAGVSRVMG